MEKVCNVCGARFEATDTCPQCLAQGRGDIRDYHWAPKLEPGEIPAAEEAPAGEEGGSESTTEGVTPLEGDLEDHTKSALSEFAASVDVPTHGTKADLIDRLREAGHG